MHQIRFGPSGNQDIFYVDGNKHSYQAPAWLAKQGLTAYEYSCGRGYNIGEDAARLIGAEAEKYNIQVSLHAPYYINLANPADLSFENGYKYIKRGLQLLDLFGGKKLVVHIGSCGKLKREDAISLVKDRIKAIYNLLNEENLIIGKYIAIETMGKFLQIGTYEEIIDICKPYENLIPTFDFGHINCVLNGLLKTEENYKKIFDLCISNLGYERTKICHIHFSKIEFGKNGGEIRHLNFDDEIFGPNFEPLARVIKEYKLTPTIICESSSHMATDALIMKNIYDSI